MMGGDGRHGTPGHGGAGPDQGLGTLYALAGVIAAVYAGSWTVWAAGALTALLSGHGWHPGTASRSLGFAGKTLSTGDPAAAWARAGGGTLGPSWLFWVLFTLLLAVLLVIVVRVAAYLLERMRGDRGAQWARPAQEKPMVVPADPDRRPWRLTAGHSEKTRRLLAAQPGVSACVFGTNGSGKTVSTVTPNVLEWDGPAVITTTKYPDLAYMMERRRQISGERVYVIAPAGLPPGALPDGVDVARWSPITGAVDEPSAGRMARWLCDASGMGADPRSKPWITQARQFIGPLLLAANASGGGMEAFVDWVARGEDAEKEVAAILRQKNFKSALRQYSSTWRLHPDGIGSIRFTGNTLIDAYQDPLVMEAAATSDFTVEDILNHKGTVFIVSPLAETEQFAPMFTALIASLIHAAIKKYEAQNGTRAPGSKPQPLENRLGLFLDEAGNVFKYPELAQLLTNARGIGIQLLTIWHDLAQLQSLYGMEAAQTIVSQSRLRMLLPGVSDPATLRFFSELAGETLVARTSHTSGMHGSSASTSLQKEHLIPTHELLQLPIGHAIAQYDNLPPIRIKMRSAETDKALLKLANPAAPTRPAITLRKTV